MEESMKLSLRSPKLRSNRLLTARAVDATLDYLKGSPQTSWDFGNTKAFVSESDPNIFYVSLYDKKILEIICDGQQSGSQVSAVRVFAGGYYDADGNPTNLTRERLNGLLDVLGAVKIIPSNVRVIYDADFALCYIARFDERIALNKDYCVMAEIKPDPDRLIFSKLNITENS